MNNANVLLDPQRWPHIYLYEVACRCRHDDCPYKSREQVMAVIDPNILDVVEVLRADFGGTPLLINSAIRCHRHNIEVNGADFSPHEPQALCKDVSPGTGPKRSYGVDISIAGHFNSPRGMRDRIRGIYSDIRIGWMEYQAWCHLDFAFRHPYKNAVMTKHWVRGGEW
jgi:hypothetical protein